MISPNLLMSFDLAIIVEPSALTSDPTITAVHAALACILHSNSRQKTKAIYFLDKYFIFNENTP